MTGTRFQVLCEDQTWQYVFCRSFNSLSGDTGSSIIPTEARSRAYVSYNPAKDLEYFQQFNRNVRTEIPTP